MLSTNRGADDLIGRLEERVARNGSAPLISYYDHRLGHRTELSGLTFANWVDKSANLLLSLDIDDNPRIANTLLRTHPGHWVGLIWALTIWQAGGRVVLDAEDDSLVEAAIIGPDAPRPIPGIETIACSLHPLGAGFTDLVPGVIDYADVFAQPDNHWHLAATESVCFSAGSTEIGWDVVNGFSGEPERLLITPGDDPWRDLSECIIRPIMTGGSTVVVQGADAQTLETIARQERARLA